MSSPNPAAGPAPNSNAQLADQINRLQQELRELSRQNRRTIKRNDGSIAFDIGELGGGESFWYFTDADENVTASEDATSGKGLARPFIPIVGIPLRSEVIPVHTSASFVATWGSGDVYRVQQPKLDIQSLLFTKDGAQGEAQYKINGAPAGSLMTVGVNQFVWSPVQTVTLTDAFDTIINVIVECRVTNATGSIGAAFVATQRQS